MAQSTNVLNARARSDKGKGPARRLRAAGLIPAVVYGQKREPTHIAVDPAAIQKAIATAHKLNTLLTLQLDGAEKRVLFREYEVDPVSRRLLHADFLEVDMSKAVKVEVPADLRPATRLRSLTGRPRSECEEGDDCEISVQSLSGKIEVVCCR